MGRRVGRIYEERRREWKASGRARRGGYTRGIRTRRYALSHNFSAHSNYFLRPNPNDHCHCLSFSHTPLLKVALLPRAGRLPTQPGTTPPPLAPVPEVPLKPPMSRGEGTVTPSPPLLFRPSRSIPLRQGRRRRGRFPTSLPTRVFLMMECLDFFLSS